MRWSDPFTGWRDGWIGRGPFIGWAVALLVYYMAFLGILRLPAIPDVPVDADVRFVIFIASWWIVPFSWNLSAKRCRDTGWPRWPSAFVFAISGLIAEWLLGLKYFILSILILMCTTPSDRLGTRVDRSPVDLDTFT